VHTQLHGQWKFVVVILQPYQEGRLGTHQASSFRFHLQALVGCILILSFVYLVQVALKAMIVIHRTLREGDPTFREELINYSRNRGHILNLSNFKDDSSPNAWDYSAWVRTYALYLEERLECFRVLRYDVESERAAVRHLS
jgi:hypothetical protein